MKLLFKITLISFLLLNAGIFKAQNIAKNAENGLTGHYYQGYAKDTSGVICFTGLTEDFSRVDSIIDFWNGDRYYRWEPVSGWGGNYSVGWIGYIYIEKSGQYGFGTISDDGSQVFIDDSMVVDNGNDQWYDWEDNISEGDTSNTPFLPFILDSGYHTISVRLYEMIHYDGIELWWLGPDADSSDIPYYGTNFHGDPPTYNPNTNWEIIPKSVLYTSKDSATAIDFSDPHHGLPNSIELLQNYPNPFNPATTIEYFIAKPSFVSIKVYNLLGEEIERLEKKFKNVGRHKINFDGNKYPSGIYFYELKTRGLTITKSMLLLR